MGWFTKDSSCLKMAKNFEKLGINFMCVPIRDVADFNILKDMAEKRINEIYAKAKHNLRTKYGKLDA